MTAEPPDQAGFEEQFGPEMASKLLRSEYPADMAAASCTCDDVYVCGAHRLLTRYDELYALLCQMHAERRQARAAHPGRRPDDG